MSRRGRGGRLSGKRWNRLVDHGVHWFEATRENLIDALLEDGYPPGGEPRSEQEEFMTLLAWQMAGDARFYGDPAAQQAFARLAPRYGRDVGLPTGPLATGSYPGYGRM